MFLYDIITEAKVKPGERKEIDLRFKKTEYYRSTIEKYSQKFENLKYILEKLERNQLLDNSSDYINRLDTIIKTETEDLAKQANDNYVRFSNLIKGIEKNCKDILYAFKSYDKFLYRGINNISDALYGKPFTERKAKDSAQNYSDIFNKKLRQKGIEARRDNSIFCTSDKRQAKQYGNLYIIFPLDGFKSTVSKKEKDLVLDTTNANLMFDREKLLELHRDLVLNTENAEKINRNWVGNPRFEDKNSVGIDGFFGYGWRDHQEYIDNAISLGKIDQKYEHLISVDNLATAEAIIKNLQLIEDDVGIAIKLGHEVMINGSYFAISALYENEIRKILGMGEIR